MFSDKQGQLETRLDGLIRLALRASVGSARPAEEGWARLRARVQAARLARASGLFAPTAETARISPPARAWRPWHSDEGFFTPGAITNWPQAEAVILGWRLSVSGLIAACRLV